MKIEFKTKISDKKYSGSYKIYVPTKEVERNELAGKEVRVTIEPIDQKRDCIVGRLDNKDIIVNLHENDVLATIETKINADTIRKKAETNETTYRISRELYFCLN